MSVNYMCARCGSARVAFRRGDWMQCKTCGFGADKSKFGPVHVDKVLAPFPIMEEFLADTEDENDA